MTEYACSVCSSEYTPLNHYAHLCVGCNQPVCPDCGVPKEGYFWLQVVVWLESLSDEPIKHEEFPQHLCPTCSVLEELTK